ncbi:MAG: VPLPA-CTERM sorting domain-containing protein [Rhodobacteraceae bacterium]|jgi:hypothetical protein|nr:VPLPA-CTERM sorting domain-containing protein [Paracoccaceae bacterium]
MLKAFVSVVFLLVIATAAPASTIRIEVTGTASGTVSGLYRSDRPDGPSPWTFNMADVPALAARHGDFLTATTGSATFTPTFSYAGTTNGSFGNCSGLLVGLCQLNVWASLAVDLVANTFEVFGAGAFGDPTASGGSGGLHLGRDMVTPFEHLGATFGGSPSETRWSVQVTDVSLVVTPLPAGALLLLTGVGALAVARRAKVRRT